MQIIIDLDGTICTEQKQFSRSLAVPIDGAIEAINSMYQNNTIIIYSGRTWAQYEMTVQCLRKYNIKYHQLILVKPIGDIWIDDRAIQFRSWNQIQNVLYTKKQNE